MTINEKPQLAGQPTQIANPSRASWRTFVQSIVPMVVVLNVALPVIYGFLTGPDIAPRLGAVLGPFYGWITVGLNTVILLLSGAAKLLALLMANPVVNDFITRTKWLSWLAPVKVK